MTDVAECAWCGKPSASADGCWKPGEVCLFGTLFCCSMACAKAYAENNAREGYRPGEPGFDAKEMPEASES